MHYEPAYNGSARINQIRVRNDMTIKYLPNADFQLWFKPVVKRAALGIACTPFVLIAMNYTNLLTPFLGLAIGYLHLFKPFLSSAGSAETAAWINMISGISTPIFVLAGLTITWFTIKMGGAPDIVYFSPTGMCFGRLLKRDNAYCDILLSKSINWTDIGKIEIIRPQNTRSNLDYFFELRRNSSNQPLTMRFGDIINSSDRQAFINILKSRYPQWVDDEALAAFAPPSDRQSYTELWLSELSAPPKRDRLTPLETGAMLFDQKYQVVNKLGVGGQGTVYLALCGTEEVVLKEFVLPVFPDKRVRKAAAVRFQEEATLLTKLDHPQIVKLKELFLEDHRAYLVLEHLTGKNLKDLVAEQGPLPASEIFRLARQMCEILVYLHGQQPPVVHRDFTPDNLILELDGRIKLIDFSVAQSFTSNVTGSVVGKPHYIAPEQFRGKPTCQSDLYSMGATLFYLATGQDPEPITTLRLKEYKANADSRLAAIIERSTKLDVTARYQKAEEVLQQLS